MIYVGKAISRKRTASYFQPMRNLHPRTAAMVEASASLEWMLVQSEVEALQLEYNLIKQHRPRYNVRYRDDKSYPWLAVPLADEIPRPRVERGPKRKGTKYFGPYAHAYAIRETLDLLCAPSRCGPAPGVFDRHRRLGRPCILFDINKCSGPCVGKVTPDEHRRIVEDFVTFMDGRTRPTLQRLEAEMRQAAEELNFELAARLRDQLGSVRKAMERQQMVSSTPEDFDIAAFAEDDLEAAVQVFFVRRGRVVGAASWSTRSRPSTPPRWPPPSSSSSTATGPTRSPRGVPARPARGATACGPGWPGCAAGRSTPGAAPGRSGPCWRRSRPTPARPSPPTSSSGPATSTPARGLKELQEALDLPEAPLRIECYDISNLQGSQVVGSMVVFEDGLARKSEYRRFEVRSVEGQDDVASLREVLTRRLARLATERDEPEDETGRRKKFAYPPNLIVVDGGRPQLAAALEAVRASASPDLPVVSLAKRMEEVYVPGTPDPVVIPGPARPCTSSSGSATRPTASPSPTTASCATGP